MLEIIIVFMLVGFSVLILFPSFAYLALLIWAVLEEQWRD